MTERVVDRPNEPSWQCGRGASIVEFAQYQTLLHVQHRQTQHSHSVRRDNAKKKYPQERKMQETEVKPEEERKEQENCVGKSNV